VDTNYSSDYEEEDVIRERRDDDGNQKKGTLSSQHKRVVGTKA
jgi:hypothetical protein